MLLAPLAESSGDAEGGFHAPSIADFFPPYIIPWGAQPGDPVPFYAVDRVMLVRIVMTVALIGLFAYLVRRAATVPGRRQNLAELALDFVRVQIVEQVMGAKGARFVPMVSVLFFSIFAMNIAGIIPFLNIAGTSRVGYPLVCALWVFVTYLVVGVRAHGAGRYLKQSLFPPGVPWIMYILITPIEFLQVFLFRPLTLALRLLANMIAGHLMLVLCFTASTFLLLEGGGPVIKFTGLLTAVAGFGITLFEILVAVLQAYIFALLAAVYLNMALEVEH